MGINYPVFHRRPNLKRDQREFEIGSHGISLGSPLTNFRGVLRGVPTIVGEMSQEQLDL